MAGGPHDGADAGGAKVEVCDDAGRGEGPGALQLEYLVAKPVGVDVLVDSAEQPLHAPVGRGRRGRQVGGEAHPPAVDGGHPAHQVDAGGSVRGPARRVGSIAANAAAFLSHWSVTRFAAASSHSVVRTI